jgi:transposase
MKYYKSTTEFNCGIDLHGREMYMCLVDREGDKLVHTNIKGNDFDFFLKKATPYRHSLTVCCECTFNWYWLADACENAGMTFVLGHALYMKAIHGGKNKNDRIDSEKIAHLLRSNLIPPAYVYPAAKRPVRGLLRQRMSYVWKRAELLTHVAMNQLAEGKEPVKHTPVDRGPWEERLMTAYEKNPIHQLCARADMHMIKAYDSMIDKLETELLKITKRDSWKEFTIIQSVPGIGNILALNILYEMDSVERFPSVKDFSSYCRLVKGSVASAGKIKGTKGAKLGNPYLRWAFGEAAVLAKRSHSTISAYSKQLEIKHGKFKGNAILANKLARAIYNMLKSGTSFDMEKLTATSL